MIDFIYERAYNFSEGLALVQKDGKWGAVDTAGRLVIDYRFDHVSTSRFVVPYTHDFDCGFREGLAIVEKDGFWGAVDKKGNTVIPFEYEIIGDFCDGFSIAQKNNRTVYLDILGNEYAWPEYKTLRDSHLRVAWRNGKAGYLNVYAETHVPFIYDDAHEFNEGLAWVQKDGKWGILEIE